MDDDDGIVEAATGSHQMTRSFSPSNLQLPTDFMSQRLDRESSLEAIHQLPGLVMCLNVTSISSTLF